MNKSFLGVGKVVEELPHQAFCHLVSHGHATARPWLAVQLQMHLWP
jgi:hypothetical protein